MKKYVIGFVLLAHLGLAPLSVYSAVEILQEFKEYKIGPLNITTGYIENVVNIHGYVRGKVSELTVSAHEYPAIKNSVYINLQIGGRNFFSTNIGNDSLQFRANDVSTDSFELKLGHAINSDWFNDPAKVEESLKQFFNLIDNQKPAEFVTQAEPSIYGNEGFDACKQIIAQPSLDQKILELVKKYKGSAFVEIEKNKEFYTQKHRFYVLTFDAARKHLRLAAYRKKFLANSASAEYLCDLAEIKQDVGEPTFSIPYFSKNPTELVFFEGLIKVKYPLSSTSLQVIFKDGSSEVENDDDDSEDLPDQFREIDNS